MRHATRGLLTIASAVSVVISLQKIHLGAMRGCVIAPTVLRVESTFSCRRMLWTGHCSTHGLAKVCVSDLSLKCLNTVEVITEAYTYHTLPTPKTPKKAPLNYPQPPLHRYKISFFHPLNHQQYHHPQAPTSPPDSQPESPAHPPQS